MTVHSDLAVRWVEDRVPAATPEQVARAVRVWAGKADDRARLREVALDLVDHPVFPADGDRWLQP